MKRKTIAARWLQHFKEDKNKLEWLVFFMGAAILAGLLIYLIVAWKQHNDRVQGLFVEWSEADRSRSPGLYKMELHNKGDITLEQVELEGLQWKNGGVTYRLPFEIDLAPRRSVTTAWLQFPTQNFDSVTVRVIGYQ